MEYEELLNKVGSFGPYQWIVIPMVCILYISDCFIFMGYVFITALPDHWCRLPDTGGNITLEEMKSAFLPLEVKDGVESYRWETYQFVESIIYIVDSRFAPCQWETALLCTSKPRISHVICIYMHIYICVCTHLPMIFINFIFISNIFI